MKKKILFFIAVFFCVSIASAANTDLADFLSRTRQNFWEITPEQCSKLLGVTVRAQNKAASIMRYHKNESMNYVRFNGDIIPEIIFYFDKKQLQSAMISIYNRGDNGAMTEKKFQLLNSQVEQFIKDLSKDDTPLQETRKFDKFRVEAVTRQDEFCDYVLRRNRKGKHPEYIQLFIYPAGKAKTLRNSLRSDAKKSQLQLNLNIEDNGDNYLDIPMVNQGSKGYCVDATVERIMKYYGSEIDQQIIAQLAESNAYTGTNIDKIINVLQKNKSKLKINADKKYDDDLLSFSEIQNFTKTYNNFAKKQKRPRLDFSDFLIGKQRKQRAKYVNYKTLISSYEYEIFRDARCKNKNDVEKFTKNIYESLNKGIPLAWVTFTFKNMKKNSPVGAFGFHMRIINGFNRKNDQIIYTDSWGKGHEKKYMSINDARAITLMLLQITPR